MKVDRRTQFGTLRVASLTIFCAIGVFTTGCSDVGDSSAIPSQDAAESSQNDSTVGTDEGDSEAPESAADSGQSSETGPSSTPNEGDADAGTSSSGEPDGGQLDATQSGPPESGPVTSGSDSSS